jgi:hypothetical protein
MYNRSMDIYSRCIVHVTTCSWTSKYVELPNVRQLEYRVKEPADPTITTRIDKLSVAEKYHSATRAMQPLINELAGLPNDIFEQGLQFVEVQ